MLTMLGTERGERREERGESMIDVGSSLAFPGLLLEPSVTHLNDVLIDME